MAQWIKGRLCGIANCPSRFYTIVDGRKVCQNGHVAQAVEIVEDDDEFRGTRKIRNFQESVGKREKENKLAVGVEGQKLHIKAISALLRAQIKVLNARFKLPIKFEQLVRTWFIQYVDKSKASPHGNMALPVSLVDTLVLLRLAFLQLQIPIYFVDLLRLIRENVLPYLNPMTIPQVYENASRSWASYGLNHDCGAPSLRVIEEQTHKVASILEIKGVKMDQRPFIYKLVNALMLPPSVYTGATLVLSLFPQRRTTPFSLKHEKESIIAVCIALKALYCIDAEYKFEDAVDWNVWSDLMLKIYKSDPNFDNTDERDVIYWDDGMINHFIEVYSATSLPSQEATNSAKPRLLKMFPISKPTQRQRNDDYDEKVHEELFEALNVTVSDSPIPYEPGEQYTIFNGNKLSQWVLPFCIETLYDICGYFISMSPQDFRTEIAKKEVPLAAKIIDKRDAFKVKA